MDNNTLINYIKTETDKGHSQDAVFNALVSAGWDRRAVMSVFKSYFGKAVNLSALRLSSITFLVEESLKIYRKNFFRFLILSISPFALSIVATSVMELLINPVTIGFTANIPIFFIIIIIVVIGLSYAVVSTLLTGVFIYSVITSDKRLSFIQLFTDTWKKLYKFWLTSVTANFWVTFGFLVLIIPGIYFFVALSFVNFIFFDENLSGSEAVNKSREYIKGEWWPVAIRLFIIEFGGWALYILNKPLLEIKDTTTLVALGLLYIVLVALLIPIRIIYPYLIYKEIKVLKSIA